MKRYWTPYYILMYLLVFGIYGMNSPRWASSDVIAAKYLPLIILKDHTLHLDSFPYLLKANANNLYQAGEHLISTYPLGTPLLSLPIYALLGNPNAESIDGEAERLSRIAADFLALMSLIGLHIFALQYLTWHHQSPTWIFNILFITGTAFGTSLWSICSDDLWQHTGSVLMVSAGLAFIGWRIPCSSVRLLFAGLAMGFAIVCRPTNIAVILVVMIYIVITSHFRSIVFAISAGLGCLPLLIYNRLTFGTILGGYSYLSSKTGWDIPNFSIFLKLFFHPSRGLFIYSPFLVLGLWTVFRSGSKSSHPIARLAIVVILVHSIVLCSWRIWDGGINYGPRLLTDILPFALLLIIPRLASTQRYCKSLFLILILISVFIHAIGVFRFDGTYVYKDYSRWSRCEILYTATSGKNEIIYPRNETCVPVSNEIVMESIKSDPNKLFGFYGVNIEPRAVLAMRLDDTSYQELIISMEALEDDRFKSHELLTLINGRLNDRATLSKPGELIEIRQEVAGALIPNKINILEFITTSMRSPRFNYVRHANTVKCSIARMHKISLI
jgi:hypothetical protein